MSDNSFREYVMNDLFSDMDGITARSMFGAYAFFKDTRMFGLIVDGKLYFKANRSNVDDYKNAGSQAFFYLGKNGKKHEMSYWEVPADVLENKEQLEEWALKAFLVSQEKKK